MLVNPASLNFSIHVSFKFLWQLYSLQCECSELINFRALGTSEGKVEFSCLPPTVNPTRAPFEETRKISDKASSGLGTWQSDRFPKIVSNLESSKVFRSYASTFLTTSFNSGKWNSPWNYLISGYSSGHFPKILEKS
jgi:hypothetical protein